MLRMSSVSSGSEAPVMWTTVVPVCTCPFARRSVTCFISMVWLSPMVMSFRGCVSASGLVNISSVMR